MNHFETVAQLERLKKSKMKGPAVKRAIEHLEALLKTNQKESKQ